MLRRVILNSQINFPIVLAPMVGLSHRALRQVIRSYLPQEAVTWWPTEMLNSRKLPYEDFEKLPELQKDPEEVYLCPQILANDPEFIKWSVKKLENWGAAGIDINMGCPVTKALRHNYGVALMGDIQYATQVVKWTKEVAKVPVSVKLRAGFNRDRDYLIKFIKSLCEVGMDFMILHPRLAHEQRRGRADWCIIKYVREQVTIPVIGNGDIQTPEDVLKMLEQTRCDGVMIGRALAAKPWLVAKIAKLLGFHHIPWYPQTPQEEAKEYFRCLLKMLPCLVQDYGREDLVIRKFNFFVKMTSVWLDFGLLFYGDCMKAKNLEHIYSILHKYLEKSSLKMLLTTELR